LAILLGITAVAIIWRRKCPYVLVGWLWFLGMSVPIIGFLQVGVVAVADRNTYLSQIGLAIAIVWAAADVCRAVPRFRPKWAFAAAMALAILMVAGWRQTWFWHDSETLWNRALACTSNNAVAHTNLAARLGLTKRPDQALVHYRLALAIEPKNVQTLSSLGGAYLGLGQTDKAEESYRKALAIDPKDAPTHSNLGFLLTKLGRYDEALKHYRLAVAVKPDFAPAYYNFGLALAEQEHFDEAIEQYQKALKLDRDNPEIHNNLGNALKARGRLNEAIHEFEEAIRLKPSNSLAHFNMALAFVAMNRLRDAELHYRRAITIDQKFVQAHWHLGRLLAGQRQWDGAMAQYRQALQIAPQFLAVRFDLATVQVARGDFPAAIVQLKTVLQIKPDCAEAMVVLADLLTGCPDRRFRDGASAMDFAQQANKLAGGKSPEVLRWLAAAQAELGHFPDAVATAQSALELAEGQRKEPLAAGLKADIARYKAGQTRPWR
jgi:protein O-mannosyl-transferase